MDTAANYNPPALPPGVEVISIEPSGVSGWVQTVRVETSERYGSIQVYY